MTASPGPSGTRVVEGEAETLELHPPGSAVAEPQPGDLFLTHDSYWAARAIRIGQRVRYHGPDRRYAFWNHAGAFLGRQGQIVEATGKGVLARHISRYADRNYVVVRIEATDYDRAQMARFYESQLRSRYGYVTIASIGFTLLTGSRIVVTTHASHICSGLVAAGLTRGEYLLPQATTNMMPADLAKMFDVPGPRARFWQL
jgi:hypothetical protein